MRRLNTLATLGAVGLLVGANLAEANPATASSEPAPDQTHTEELALIGFDEEVAEANGYEIRTLSNGRQYSVPVGTEETFTPAFEDTAPPAFTAFGYDVVDGTCGSSSISIIDTRWSTTYVVRDDVLFGKWGVTISSNWGVSDYNLDHGPGGSSFSRGGTPRVEHTGYGWAQVNAGSFVQLVDGGQCASGLPRATNVFQ